MELLFLIKFYPKIMTATGKPNCGLCLKGRGANAIFYIINSSDNTVRAEPFGWITIIRELWAITTATEKPILPFGEPGRRRAASFFYVKQSSDGTVITVPWGFVLIVRSAVILTATAKWILRCFDLYRRPVNNTSYVLRSSDNTYTTTVFPFHFTLSFPAIMTATAKPTGSYQKFNKHDGLDLSKEAATP